MRRLRLFVLPAVMMVIAAACTSGGDGDGDGGDGTENKGTVNVLNALEPEENAVLQAITDDLIHPDVDYQVEFEVADDIAQQIQIRSEGGTLDLVLVPQPGAVQEQAASGNAVSLEDMGFDIADIESTFGEYFVSLGEFEGEHYGIPTNINLKSMVWYPKDDFDAAGYEIPTTWDQMIALSDQIVADGGTPWCVGFESGGDTGWPATDWMEDIMLRTAGPEVYDQWITHAIPFNDPAVAHAGELFGDIMFAEGYVLGGADQTPSIAFADAPAPMFEDPPGCWLHRQASFINALFPEGVEAGVDYDWFPFPDIETEGGPLFAGELAVVFSNRPEIVDFLTRFMAVDVQCAMGKEPGSSRISPNVNVGSDCYPNPILADASEVLTAGLESGAGRFDAGDQMPPQVGSGAFWTEMMAYMQGGPGSLSTVLDNIEASWPAE